MGCEQSPESEAKQNRHQVLCTLCSRGRLLGCTEQVAERNHCSSLKGNGHKQLAPRHPSHHQSATDQDDTVVFSRRLLTQVLLGSKRADNKIDCPKSSFGRRILRTTPSLLVWRALTELHFSEVGIKRPGLLKFRPPKSQLEIANR